MLQQQQLQRGHGGIHRKQPPQQRQQDSHELRSRLVQITILPVRLYQSAFLKILYVTTSQIVETELTKTTARVKPLTELKLRVPIKH